MSFSFDRQNGSQFGSSLDIHPRSKSNLILLVGPGFVRRTVEGSGLSLLRSSTFGSRCRLSISSEGVSGSPHLSRSSLLSL